jgi:hypothetical protein
VNENELGHGARIIEEIGIYAHKPVRTLQQEQKARAAKLAHLMPCQGHARKRYKWGTRYLAPSEARNPLFRDLDSSLFPIAEQKAAD